jgi:asparagine synthetase B (glutamine-hydrolysing)
MIDKKYCMSSFVALRYIEKENVDFFHDFHHHVTKLPSPKDQIIVSSTDDVDEQLNLIFRRLERQNDKLGILLSGGMDSACLASYMPRGSDAYTFRFLGGAFAQDELKRAEIFSKINDLNLYYVDITWENVLSVLPNIMKHKAAPVHSIEPQIYLSAKQAQKNGITKMVIGDAADYVFYGMDGLLSKDWNFNDFYKRSIYIDPSEVLVEPVSIRYLYERYRIDDDKIDFIKFYDKSITEESYGSYENAFETAEMPFVDPYENFKMSKPVDLVRTRNGDSKYFIRELFRRKYPNIILPEKSPMPRPVDEYFKDWKGPQRPEFRNDINIQKYSGNQKWLLWCLEQFLNYFDK